MGPLPIPFPHWWKCPVVFWDCPSCNVCQWGFTQVRVTRASFAYLRLLSLTLALGKQCLPGAFIDNEEGPLAARSLIQLKFLGCRWHQE